MGPRPHVLCSPASAMRYRTFAGADVERTPHFGRRVALLLERSDVDPALAATILDALDRAADFYADLTGREPGRNRDADGRIPIAEVDGIGGAAWAWLGETGIEIQPRYLDVLLRGVRDEGVFDQPLFYELGRNWWFWSRTLDVDPGSVCTGYAVAMRFRAMDAAGVRGAPFGGWPFERFRGAVASLLDRFLETPSLRWEALLAGAPVAVHTFREEGLPALTLSTADLIASTLERLAAAHGGLAWWKRFLRAADRLEDARDARGIAHNVARAASEAAGRDVAGELRGWRWPR